MRLQPHQSIDDLRADRLQALGHIDVGLLVEARLQLHDDRDFLAQLRRLLQQIDQHRPGAGAVQRHPDRDHLRVGHRLPEEIDDRLETLERVV